MYSSIFLEHDHQRLALRLVSDLLLSLRSLVAWLLFFCAVNTGSWVFAQPVEPVPSPSPVVSPAVTLPAKPAIKGDIIYMPNKQGELVPVPYNADLEKYLEFLNKEAEAKTSKTNVFSFNTLKLDGTVSREANGDEYLELSSLLEFNLLTADWVEIPLRFLEASVTDTPVHKGPGEVVYKGRDRTQGQVWFAKGEGLHTLSMKMVVPIRKQFASRRVQLQVPEALRNELNIEFPHAKIALKTNDESKLLKNQSVNNKTRVALVGFTDRLDFNWTVETNSPQAQKSLESDLSMTLQEDAQGFLINAQQQIINLAGDVKQLNIQLPKDWEFVKVEADGLVSQLIKQNKKDRDLITLNFSNSLNETTLLRWQFRMLNKQIGNKIFLDGLKVQGATRETGVIRLERTSSRRTIPVNYDNQVVVPVGVDTLIDSRNLVGAFRINSQPFSLNLDVEQIQSYFSVEPEYRLIMTDKQCELQGRFLITVYRGSLNNLSIEWPGLDIGLNTTEITSPTNLIRNITWPDSTKGGNINVDFVEGQAKQCELFLRSQLEHTSNQEPFAYTFPKPNAPIVLPARFVILNAKNIETQVQVLADTTLTPLESWQPLTPFPGFLNNSANLQSESKQYRLKGDIWKILCNVRSYEQEIISTSHLTARLLPHEIQINQLISNQIQHEPLSRLNLQIPQTAQELQIQVKQNQLEVKNVISVNQSKNNDVSLEFTTPISGLCEIQASYRLPIQHAETQFNLPIIICKDNVFSKITYEAVNSTEGFLSPNQTDWKIIPERLNTIYEFQSGESTPEYINVKQEVKPQFTNIDNASSLVMVSKQSSRVLHGVAVYRFDKLPEVLEFEIKENTWIKSTAYWNQAPVKYEFLDDQSAKRLKIHIPETPTAGPYQLLLPFESQTTEASWSTYPATSLFNQLQINAPRLVKGAWVRYTIWEVNLSGNDTLFETTTQAESLNTWFWNWFGVSLHASLSQQADLTSSVKTADSASTAPVARYAQTYRFLSQGPTSEISLVTVNGLLVIFSGLVLGLITAFLCLNTGKILAGRVLFFTLLALISGYIFLPTGTILWGQYFLSGIILGLIAFYFDDIHLRSNRKRPVIVFSNDSSSLQMLPPASPMTDSESTRLHQPSATPAYQSSQELSGVNY